MRVRSKSLERVPVINYLVGKLMVSRKQVDYIFEMLWLLPCLVSPSILPSTELQYCYCWVKPVFSLLA